MDESSRAERPDEAAGRLARAYVAAARRDPRDAPFGYLAIDPTTGARGAFLWFASPTALVSALATIEVGLLGLDAGVAASVEHAARRGSPARGRFDQVAITAAFQGWSEIAWIGSFYELCSQGGEFAVSLRAAFRERLVGRGHAGPVCDTEMEDFICYLVSLAGLTDA